VTPPSKILLKYRGINVRPIAAVEKMMIKKKKKKKDERKKYILTVIFEFKMLCVAQQMALAQQERILTVTFRTVFETES
jgi:hypothetical protein